jgi:hypothetical protein
VLTLVQAAGLVDPHPDAEAGFFRQLLQPGVQIALSIGGAGAARRIGGTGVVADKDMVFECWQAVLLNVDDSRVNLQRPFSAPYLDFETWENSLPTAMFPQSPHADPAESAKMDT